ncbi:MAG TPA: hypothetical protein VGP07_10825 [Polyangia bacterium]|jgi:hypothetical protein
MTFEMPPIHRGARRSAAIVAAAFIGLLAGCSSEGSPGADAATACPQSVQQRCAQGDPPAGEFGVHCAQTLAAAEADPSFCASLPDAHEETCGSYKAVVVTNVDFSYIYYYDASGALIAIASNGLVKGMQCLAGSPGFVLPSPCTDDGSLPVCAGAGP